MLNFKRTPVDSQTCSECVCEHKYTHSCSDDNPCDKNNGGCHEERKCVNGKSGITCGDCPAGWDNDGDKGCKGLLGLVNL